jgi:hypothetical protein
MKGYTEMLYRDQNIIAEMIDSPLPMGAPELNVFPAKIYRLWQIAPRFTDYYKEAARYADLLERLDPAVRHAITVEKFRRREVPRPGEDDPAAPHRHRCRGTGAFPQGQGRERQDRL